MVRKFRVFLSYGDEALKFKDRVKRLAEEAFAKTLENTDGSVILNVIEWRDLPARRAPGGGKTNDLHVEMAMKSAALVVLLMDEVPPGTQEELEAVLGDPGIEVVVLWLNPQGATDTEVARFLKEKSDVLRYKQLAGELDSEDTWVQISANLVYILLIAIGGVRESPFYESRA
jgi:hypothetical protein